MTLSGLKSVPRNPKMPEVNASTLFSEYAAMERLGITPVEYSAMERWQRTEVLTFHYLQNSVSAITSAAIHPENKPARRNARGN